MLFSEPINNRGTFQIFRVYNRRPKTIKMKDSPNIFEAQRKVKPEEVFNTPSPTVFRPGEIFPAGQMKFPVECRGSPEKIKHYTSELLKDSGRERSQTHPIYQDAR